MSIDVRKKTVLNESGSVNGWGWAPMAIMVLFVAVFVSACGGSGVAKPATTDEPPASTRPVVATATRSASSSSTTRDAACADGMITVGDLLKLDAVWQAKLATFHSDATAWHADASLLTVNLSCYMSNNVEWNARYSSTKGNAQLTLPDKIEMDSASIADPFNPATISFAKLHDWLIAAGYDDATDIPGGIDISTSFAPDGTPGGIAFFRVSHAESPGEAYVYVNVDSRDGKTFTSDF